MINRKDYILELTDFPIESVLVFFTSNNYENNLPFICC